jgi:hypothetical protein
MPRAAAVETRSRNACKKTENGVLNSCHEIRIHRLGHSRPGRFSFSGRNARQIVNPAPQILNRDQDALAHPARDQAAGSNLFANLGGSNAGSFRGLGDA